MVEQVSKVVEPKQKIQVDLEVDTSVKDLGPNPYAKLIHLAKAVDSWRIFPRLFLTVYIVLLYQVVHWFMEIDTPNLEQSGLSICSRWCWCRTGLVYMQELKRVSNGRKNFR